MDGPYRDIGSGFVRLSGLEAPRRARSTISCTEDVLRELLANAFEADAANIFVSTFLRSRRYRTIHVLDDGVGVPQSHAQSIFEPGVTSQHPGQSTGPRGRGSGLSLHHIRNASIEARLLNSSAPTSIKATLDTREIPERSLQSSSRVSKTNLLATARSLTREYPETSVYLGSPSAIISIMLKNNIIPSSDSKALFEEISGLGFEVSSRTLKRVLGGEITPAELVSSEEVRRPRRSARQVFSHKGEKVEVGSGSVSRISLSEEDEEGIMAILRGAARASYLEIGAVRFESSEGRISVEARVVEPEDDEVF